MRRVLFAIATLATPACSGTQGAANKQTAVTAALCTAADATVIAGIMEDPALTTDQKLAKLALGPGVDILACEARAKAATTTVPAPTSAVK